MYQTGIYKDLFTGKNVAQKFRGKLIDDTEDFHLHGEYRKSKTSDNCSLCARKDGVKCKKLGISPESANDIALDHICNFFKSSNVKRKTSRPKSFSASHKNWDDK